MQLLCLKQSQCLAPLIEAMRVSQVKAADETIIHP